ncbi:hypothetical protein AXG93_4368s1230 [Marchantia polymorpha subsp. ruderalis]|uniref:Uncharacterized protein n=1 Tax=Marchantia polymorpha subsp. ruderalis TaxID=1480154 RepID=A0A176VZ47_MARPO|nr:hypothetical protein AXG93_4368s1230 [Marchantia polymorpha subsp. ruderalis]
MGSKRPPPDLPGMYFDVERNRYFPLKSRMSTNEDSRMKSAAEQLRQDEESARSAREDAILYKRRIPKTAFSAMEKSEDGNAILRLLYQRELSGHNWRKRAGANCSVFERQILESYTGHMNSSRVQPPKIWTYLSVHCDGGIEQCRLDIQTASGQVEVDAMVVGGFNEVQTLQVCGPEDISIWGDGSFMSQNNPRLKAGAAILDIERSEVYRTFIAKSSVLAQQFDNSVSISYSSVQSSLNLVEENDMSLLRSNEFYLIASAMDGQKENSAAYQREFAGTLLTFQIEIVRSGLDLAVQEGVNPTLELERYGSLMGEQQERTRKDRSVVRSISPRWACRFRSTDWNISTYAYGVQLVKITIRQGRS